MKSLKNDLNARYLSPRKDDTEKHIYELLKMEPKDWPPPFRMTDEAIKEKYARLSQILEKNRYIIEFAEALPIHDAYRYLTEVFLYTKSYELNEGWVCHVTGCGGDCPGCFQRDYCDALSDIWTQEEMEAELIQRCMSIAQHSTTHER
jgi:hypothetical protein